MYACSHVCGYICMHLNMCACVCGGQILILCVFFDHSPLYLLRQSLLLNLELKNLISLVSQLALGSPVSSTQVMRLQSGHHTSLAFMWVLGNLDSGPHDYVANALVTGPSSQSPNYALDSVNRSITEPDAEPVMDTWNLLGSETHADIRVNIVETPQLPPHISNGHRAEG